MPDIVPGTGMSKTWPCFQRAEIWESTGVWTYSLGCSSQVIEAQAEALEMGF